jgi:hypothetical protein
LIGNLLAKRKGSPFVTIRFVLKQNAVRHGREFIKHVVPAVIKPARTLWNQIIGFFFICFAAWFGTGAIRYGREFLKGDAQSPVAFLLAAFCFLVTFYFGLTSFLRARRISRS